MKYDLRIRVQADTTHVKVEPNVLTHIGDLLRSLQGGTAGRHAVILTDRHVGGVYGSLLRRSLRAAGFNVLDYRIEPGEESKSLSVAGKAYQFLAGHAIARDAILVALGGGVVSDLAGFVAATWMRGIGFAVCPTTLEADVDACIGGKTAVNLPGVKNLVGAFHQPTLVAVDPVCLNTLDPRDIRAGLAESVKHALISSGEFLEWHEAEADAILALDETVTTELILRNLRIKAGIVEQDAFERTGLRSRLNFGHTIGHAIEASCGFAMRHGECVALGMLAACRISRALGMLQDAVVARVGAILKRFGLPAVPADAIETDRILAVIRNDKKIHGGAQRWVLLEDVGRPVIRDDVPEQHVREAYESLLP